MFLVKFIAIPKQSHIFVVKISGNAMGNWNEQQDRKKMGNEKDKVRKEKLAGYFFDISKLIFAALVLGGFSPIFGIEYHIIDIAKLILGFVSTVTFAIFANKILK